MADRTDLTTFRTWCRKQATQCTEQAEALRGASAAATSSASSLELGASALDRDAQLWSEQADAIDQWLDHGMDDEATDAALADLFSEAGS